ncbi:hypothetical protein [Variovorax sp. LT1R16]|uniref:hypothetical protein n=1 Tax=Variovorax sp. LT1R16 TaxID=3443728 RepID=UPI003F47FB0E
MAPSFYTASDTALLLIDPYNDLLSDTGKLQGRAKDVMTQLSTIAHMREVVVGCRSAGIAVETTGKFGVELGYHVTLVRDATAAFSTEAMNVAHEINGPTCAHAIVDTAELLAMLSP